MSDLVFLNGSPKSKKSTSKFLIDEISSLIGDNSKYYKAIDILKSNNSHEFYEDILYAKALLIVFPLYVDGIPASLLKILELIELECKKKTNNNLKVYAVINCGFYDSIHNLTALEMIKIFSLKCNFSWQYGIGIGCGGFFSSVKSIKHGPSSNVYKVLLDLCKNIKYPKDKSFGNILVNPNIPRTLYKYAGELNWNMEAMKNKAFNKIKAKPHIKA